jgi:2-C-methyl-D-erythritol 4-phosphate cytidylyltransferase
MSSAGAVAVVFAGGTGSRMRRAEEPKQFVTVEGKPILVRTLEHFQRHPDVFAVYVACVRSHVDDAWSLVRTFGLDKVRRIVPGGDSAQESIYNGLRSAVDDEVEDDVVVLVHDGVRPLINQALISRNVASDRTHGNAITAIPCFETVARSQDSALTIASVTRRDEMHVLQAPQTFRLGTACTLNARSVEHELMGTFVDQAQLHRHYGEQLHLVRGLRGNVKLTTDLDLLQYQLLASSGHLVDVLGEDV